MSFDVFLQCYGKTAQSGLSREHVRSLFPVVEEDSDPKRWVVRYGPTDRCDFYVDAEDEKFHDLMVSRPCADERLWEALLAVLQMGDVVMFWPGSPPMIASAEGVTRLPEEMVASLGAPVLVSLSEQFFELLKAT